MERKRSNNDLKRNRILFDFESIVDLKLSYIRKFLIENGKGIIEQSQMNEFKWIRMNKYKDPLALVTKDPIPEEELIHPAVPVFTGMKTLIERYLSDATGLITPVVLCKDEFQQRIIKDLLPTIKILVGSRDKVKTSNFSRIVVGNAKHCLEFRDPITVDFMILNFRENFAEMDSTLLNEEILIKVGDVNRFTICTAYPEIPDPKG